MINLIIGSYKILDKKFKVSFLFVIILQIFSSLLEVLAVFSIAPLVSVISNNHLVHTNIYLNKIYNLLLFENLNNFIIFLGLSSFFVMLLSSSFLMITNFLLIKFSHNIGHFLSCSLYENYLLKDWLFFSRNASYSLSKKINTDVGVIVSNVIIPLLFFFSKLFFVVFIFISIIFINVKVAVSSIIIFLFFYSIFYIIIKKRLKLNSKLISESSEKKYKLINEGFDGIKDIIIANANQFFINRFNKVNQIIYSKSGNIVFLSQLPRNILEVLAIGVILFVLIFLLSKNQGEVTQILPLLSIYALSGLKLIPSIQLIFNNFSLIKSGSYSFYEIYDDILSSKNKISQEVNHKQDIIFKNIISIKKLNFSYTEEVEVLNNLSIEIKKNQTIGIIGPNGSGKSTILDILLGLIITEEGCVYVDDKKITKINVNNWQKKIGYVSQNFHLFEGSIINNIAFGENFDQINFDKINLAIKYSGLDELINKLPKGLKTNINEKGLNLSGGQKQKINIARCIYRDPDILILDEATNALDYESENIFLNMVKKFYNKKTIIFVTHKIELLKDCDVIFYIKNGKVALKGPYSEIVSYITSVK